MKNLFKCLLIVLSAFLFSEASMAQSYQTINYYMTNYCTNGSGGWLNGGMSPSPAKSYRISDSKIIDGDNASYTYIGEATLFNVPVSVYVSDRNDQIFLLRSGNELMFAMTNIGLFLSELQQAGVNNQRLSRYNIPGFYNANESFAGSNSSSSASASDAYIPVKVLEIHSGMSISTTYEYHNWYKRYYGNRWCLFPVKGGSAFYTASRNNDSTCEGFDVSGYAYKAIKPSGTSAYGIQYYYFN